MAGELQARLRVFLRAEVELFAVGVIGVHAELAAGGVGDDARGAEVVEVELLRAGGGDRGQKRGVAKDVVAVP